MEVALIRFAWTPMGTFGVLRVPTANFTCYTVERPWLNNERNVSCVPAGRYGLRKTMFYRGTDSTTDDYEVYQLLNVPGRSLIKIHRGNTMLDVKGCIALGAHLGWINDCWAVSSSRFAFDHFMQAMGGEFHATLSIIDQAPFDWRGWPP